MTFLLRRHSKSNPVSEGSTEKPTEGRWGRLKRPLSIIEPRRQSIAGNEQIKTSVGSPILSEPVTEEEPVEAAQEEIEPPVIPQRTASRTFFKLKSIMINRSHTDLSSLIKGYGTSSSGYNTPAISTPIEANSRHDTDQEVSESYESAEEEEDELRFLEGIDRSIGQWISVSDDYRRYSICESTIVSVPSSPRLPDPQDSDASEDSDDGEYTVTQCGRTVSNSSTATAAPVYGHKHEKSNSLTLSSSSSVSFMSAATPITPVVSSFRDDHHYGVVYVGGIDEMIEEEEKKHLVHSQGQCYFDEDEEDVILLSGYRRVRTVL